MYVVNIYRAKLMKADSEMSEISNLRQLIRRAL